MGCVMRDMKNVVIMLAVMAMGLSAHGQETDFGQWFSGGTLRIDCLREGSALGDSVWVARWVDRRNPWHGSHTQTLDPFDGGDYRVSMRDAATGREIYSRGYSNLFREYKGTAEGRTTSRRFEETLLLPMPLRAVDIALQARDTNMRLYDQTVVRFDPARDRLTAGPDADQVYDYEIHGPSATKFDIAFVMQGFDDEDDIVYRKACRRMAESLFGHEPFASRRRDFNIRFVKAYAGVEYNTFGADRYAMTFAVRLLHDAVGTTPADHIIVVINNRTYGGGAIYNFYSVSSLHKAAELVLTHELGHGIGGLADEYVDEELSYADLHRTAYEPLEPNITNMVDFGSKWQSMIAADTPIPTPADDAVPRTECGPLGAYEGAGYSSTGMFRPTMRCMMRDYAPFCPVCAKRLNQIIDLYTR